VPDFDLQTAKGRVRLARVLRAAGDLVTVHDAADALDVDRRTAAKLLARWAEQGWLKRLRRGIYSPIPVDAVSAERTLENPWVLVPALFSPGYVGGWSAAEHWDLTEQIFRDVCVFTARPFRHKREEFEGIGFVLNRSQEDHLVGLDTVWKASVRIPVSDPHRTILDMLARPPVGGGIRHAAECLTTYLGSSFSDLGKLIEYADRLGNGAVFKRLGFLLERTESPDARAIQACRERISSGYAKLDPAFETDALVKQWRLRVPVAWQERQSND
jgi:predicted transcriptional regulator of viral defense system